MRSVTYVCTFVKFDVMATVYIRDSLGSTRCPMILGGWFRAGPMWQRKNRGFSSLSFSDILSLWHESYG